MRTSAPLLALGLAIATGCTIQVVPTGGAPSPKPGTSASPGVTTKPTPSSLGSPGPVACAALFAKLDKGGDGKLTKAEYVDGMRAIYDAQHAGETYTSCGKPDVPALLAAAYEYVDFDADGTVTRAEFMQDCEAAPKEEPWTVIRRPYLSPARCDQHFAKHDADGDGTWSRAEFEKGFLWPYFPFGPIVPRAVLRYGLLCSAMPMPPIDTLFRGFDENGDGRLDQGEVCALLTGAKVLVTPPPEPASTPTPVATATPAVTPTPASTARPSALPSLAPDAVVLRLEYRGGMCMYGGCSTVITVRADGQYERTEGPGTPKTGTAPAERVAALRAALGQADLAKLKARAFTGMCPTAYDGNEVVYAFPSAFGDERLPSCKYELDPEDPLLKAARELGAAARQ